MENLEDELREFGEELLKQPGALTNKFFLVWVSSIVNQVNYFYCQNLSSAVHVVDHLFWQILYPKKFSSNRNRYVN